MATMEIGYRHAPKPRGNSASTPFTNWAKGTIDTRKGGGFTAQNYKYIWSGSTDSATRIKWGDTNVGYRNFTNNGKSGEIYCDDHYSKTTKSHNVLWCVEWAPYSMSVAGVSFDFVQSHQSTGWGFGKMFLFYRYNGTGSSRVREITPISGCKTGNNENFTFHRQNTSTYGDINNLQDQSYGTRAHLIAAGSDPGPEYLCVGWGGFYTITNQANTDRDHGFKFDNFYLLPSGDISTSSRWIGGKCHTSNKFDGRHINIK
jgi:hypothetical protein